MSNPFKAIWDSSQQLSTLLGWLTLGLIFSTALLSIAIYKINERIGSLQSDRIIEQDNIIKEQDRNIAELKSKSEELSKKSIRAERGISETYDFNGARRKNIGSGKTAVEAGNEMNIFYNIVNLYNEKKWKELNELCERQIMLTPSWLTPFLFSGVALLSLSEYDRAKERLEFVVKNSGDDPSYSDASRLLRELNARDRSQAEP
ncbi:MAG: hypothetical protein U1E25_14515 [Methylocystis sp.]